MTGSGAPTRFEHVIDIYASDAALLDRVSQFLADALTTGGAALVVATAEHRRDLASALQELPLADLRAAGRLIELDASETLASFSPAGDPDPIGFRRSLEPLVSGLASHGGKVHVYGEMVALLWERGRIAGVVELETCWNELGASVPFSLYCSYPSAVTGDTEHAESLELVCGLHTEARGLDTALASTQDWGNHTRRTFDATVRAPGEARRFVRETLARWGSHADETQLGDVELVITELVTNAVCHARSPHRVELSNRAAGLRIVVEDNDPTLPFAAAQPENYPRGRGLAIVAAVCERWGYEQTHLGKVVWAELRLGTVS